MFDFVVTYISPDGTITPEPSNASMHPETWEVADVVEVLRVAAAHRSINFDRAFADLTRGPEGVTIRLGTTEAGTLSIGPLSIRNDVALAFVNRAGWSQFNPASRPN